LIEPELRLNWVPSSLKDVANEFISGGTPSTKETDFWDGEIPWTTSSPISEQDVILNQAQRYITQKGLQNSASNIVPKGNLIVGTRVGVGKSVTNAIDIAISQDLTGVVLNHEKVMPEFIAYFFKIQKVQQYLDGRKRGTTIKGISRFDLQTLKIDLPPFPEQRAIARALRAVQGAREARLREVALERERKAALMEHLFTHGTRGEATKQTEIGEMPESWKVVQLGTLLISGLRNGLYKSAEFFNKGFAKIIELSNLYNSNRVLKVDDTMRSIEATQEEIDRYSLNDGDIIINRVSKRREGVAQARLLCLSDNIGVPILYESNMFRATLNDELINSKYFSLFALTDIYSNQVMAKAQKGNQTSINQPALKSIFISLPSTREQSEIENILTTHDSKIAALEHEARLLEELFRAMLEELMSGRLPAGALVEDAA